MKIAYVEWLDAHGFRGPLTLSETVANDGLLMKSCGILVSEDTKAVRIAQDYWAQEGESEQFRDVEIIPRAYVKKMKTWNVAKRPSRV